MPYITALGPFPASDFLLMDSMWALAPNGKNIYSDVCQIYQVCVSQESINSWHIIWQDSKATAEAQIVRRFLFSYATEARETDIILTILLILQIHRRTPNLFEEYGFQKTPVISGPVEQGYGDRQ